MDPANPFAGSPPLPLFDPTIARVVGASASGTGVSLDLVSEAGTEFSYTVPITAKITIDGKEPLPWLPNGLTEWVMAMCKFGTLDVRLTWDSTEILQVVKSAEFITNTK